MTAQLARVPTPAAGQPLVETIGLKKYFWAGSWLFGRKTEALRALDGVNLKIWPGESLGLAGETGSGKSTFGLCVLRLLEATEGEILFEGGNIARVPAAQMRRLRTHMQIVFQNPYSSLNPRMRIKNIVAEPLRLHQTLGRAALDERVRELMALVGLEWEFAYRLPHELSGGQRQRVAIARAIALHPKFLVLDEPTSALDVSVQAQVLNLLVDLQERLGLTYLFISHDLGVIRYLCNRVAIMYRGRVVEVGRVQEIFEDARHPYTRSLLSSMLEPDPDHRINEAPLIADRVQTSVEMDAITDTHWVAQHTVLEPA